MKFSEKIHWSDGLFVQAPHFQLMQRNLDLEFANHRQMFSPYPFGLLDYDLDTEALHGEQLRFTRLSAVMPDGNCLSYPGNMELPTLDVSSLEIGSDGVMVYLAVPEFSETEANLGEKPVDKRQFLVKEKAVRDDNTGQDEIVVITRHYNGRLLHQGETTSDMVTLPLLKLTRSVQGVTGMALTAAKSYIPPFLRLVPDCPLYTIATDLVHEMQLRRDVLLADFAKMGFSTDTMTGNGTSNMMQLFSINSMLAEMEAALQPGYTSPFGLYTMMLKFFRELSALNPLLEFPPLPGYDHLNCHASIGALLQGIRSMLHSNRGFNFIQVDFVEKEGLLTADLAQVPFAQAEEFYLMINYAANSNREVVSAMETGDAIRLLNPSSIRERTRGIQLQEFRYPPRCLPALPNAFWFLLTPSGSNHVWDKIAEEKALVLDREPDTFPQLTASLFITLKANNGEL